MSNISVLDKTVCVQLVVSLWSGKRRLRKEDLGGAADQLPPEDLSTLGSLKLCDPKIVSKLNNIKRAAERDCRSVCVEFMAGYATDEANLPSLFVKLDAHAQRFEKAAADLKDALPGEIRSWGELHPKWKALLERAPPDVTRVASRFAFGFRAFRVGPATDQADDAVNGGLLQATGGLAGQLFAEIEAEAKKTLKDSYDKRESVGRKALRPILHIQNKLQALRYLDSRCQPMIDQITLVLGQLPKLGPIAGANLSAVVGLLHILESGDRLRAHGAGVLEARSQPVKIDDPNEADESFEGEMALPLGLPPAPVMPPGPADSGPAVSPRPNGAGPSGSGAVSRGTWL
jgi:Protein of unknown function (DUF3150)